jgi:hypothetical protein
MKVFDIPLDADSSHGWIVPIPGDGEETFESREAAIGFAAELAHKQLAAYEEPSFVCVEGADGRWRLFDANMKPVTTGTLPPSETV